MTYKKSLVFKTISHPETVNMTPTVIYISKILINSTIAAQAIKVITNSTACVDEMSQGL